MKALADMVAKEDRRAQEAEKQLAAAQATIATHITTAERTWHRCDDGKIMGYPAILCSRGRHIVSCGDFDPMKALTEAERELSEAKATIAGQGERVSNLRNYLRAVVVELGGVASSEVSDQFLSMVPEEARAHEDRLKRAEQALTRAGWVRCSDGQWRDPRTAMSDTIKPMPPGRYTIDSQGRMEREHPTATAGSAGETVRERIREAAMAEFSKAPAEFMYGARLVLANAIAAAIVAAKGE